MTNHRCELYPHKVGIKVHQVVMHLEYDHSGECICTRPYVDAGLNIDHLNAEKLDNRVHNLNYVHKGYNSSKKGLRTSCSSVYNGVSWFKKICKWQEIST